jgi:hypothetical protein
VPGRQPAERKIKAPIVSSTVAGNLIAKLSATVRPSMTLAPKSPRKSRPR